MIEPPRFRDVDMPGTKRAVPPPPPAESILALFSRPREIGRIKFSKRIPWKALGVSALAMILIVFAVGGFYLNRLRRDIVSTARDHLMALGSAVDNSGLLSGFPAITPSSSISGTPSISAMLAGGFIPTVENLGGAYKSFESLSASALALVDNVNNLENLAPDFVAGRNGGEVMTRLRAIRSELDDASSAAGDLMAKNPALQGVLPISPNDYLALQVNIAKAKGFLDAVIPWVGSDTPRRIAVFLENPSEIRPGGGFVGSYAEVVVEQGAVKSVTVHDINYADRALDLTIVPPEPVQTIAKRWRAADANWFFDFSTSARKTLSFLEASDVYASSSETFDGAIGLSANAVGDTLTLTGPITLPSGLTVTKDNFLSVIQSDVQANQAVGADDTKEVLAELAPLLIEKLTALPSPAFAGFLPTARSWIANRDVRVYMKDDTLEHFFDSYDATGKVAEIPAKWNGDYFALADANLGGGKTDIYMKEDVHLEIQMGADAVLNDHLVFDRSHTGDKAKDWWYKVPNEEYIEVLTPPDANLDGASGGMARKIVPPVKYDAQGFTDDPEVDALENTRWEHLGTPSVSSFTQSGKNMFATWSKVDPGAKAELVFDYSRKLPALPADGQTFDFVFEKQSGTSRSYDFEFTAPVGFRFKENHLPTFEYKTNDPPGRLDIELTLEKI